MDEKPIIVNVINSAFLLPALFRGQMRYFDEHGYDMHIVTHPDEYLDQFAETEPVTPHALTISRTISPIRDAMSIVQLWWKFRKLKPTIVHTHTPKGGLIGMMAAWLAGVPVRIYHIHGLPMSTMHGLRRWLIKACESFCCRLAHRTLCVSHSVEQEALEHKICPPERLQVPLFGSANGIDCNRYSPSIKANGEWQREQFNIPSDAIVIGFVGRLKAEKGIVALARAWQELREDFPKAHLMLVGPFEEHDAVPLDVCEMFRNDPRVHCIGRVADALPCFSVIDIAVLPSYREGLSTFLLESMAVGLPIVTTDVPGCIDLVESENTGLVVPAQDVDALTSALGRYLSDPQLRKRHGQSARQQCVARYQQAKIWSALQAVYEELLGKEPIEIPQDSEVVRREAA